MCMGCQESGQGQPHHLFIAPTPNPIVTLLSQILRGHQIGGGAPIAYSVTQWSNSNDKFELAVGC